jgi:hypothetical protein
MLKNGTSLNFINFDDSELCSELPQYEGEHVSILVDRFDIEFLS